MPSNSDSTRSSYDQFAYELDFNISGWAEPSRYIVIINAAGAIAIVAATAQIWSSLEASTDVRSLLIKGLLEYLYGILFGCIFVVIGLVMALAKHIVATILVNSINELSTPTLWLMNRAWLVIYIILLIAGYTHFFCNSFSLLHSINSYIPESISNMSPNLIRGCPVSKTIVHRTADYLASWFI